MGVKVENNFKQARQEYKQKRENALFKMGLLWLNEATKIVSSRYSSKERIKTKDGYKEQAKTGIVDTGRLRASLSFITSQNAKGNNKVSGSKSSDKLSGSTSPNELIVGSNVDYSVFIEKGTAKMKARPFVVPAIEENKSLFEKILQDELTK